MCPLFHPHPPSARRAWGPPVYPYQGESKVHSLHKEGPGPCPCQPRWLWNAFSPPEGGLGLGPPYLGRRGVPYLHQERLGSHLISTGVSLVSTLSARRTHLVSHHCSRRGYPSLCREVISPNPGNCGFPSLCQQGSGSHHFLMRWEQNSLHPPGVPEAQFLTAGSDAVFR